jgi:acyl-CoA synthetase (NDP forming)
MDFSLLSKYKLPVLPFQKVFSIDQAVRAAKKIGYPIALKLISPNILHKSDVGALALNIRDRWVLESEFRRLEKMASKKPTCILVQGYRPGRFELIIGGRTDMQFGPIVLLGSGGIYTEVLRDMAIRICPINKAEAISMIRSLRSYPILSGARGRMPIDEGMLAKLILRVSLLMQKEMPLELDLNPVLVRNDGFWIADVRIIRQAKSMEAKQRL